MQRFPEVSQAVPAWIHGRVFREKEQAIQANTLCWQAIQLYWPAWSMPNTSTNMTWLPMQQPSRGGHRSHYASPSGGGGGCTTTWMPVGIMHHATACPAKFTLPVTCTVVRVSGGPGARGKVSVDTKEISIIRLAVQTPPGVGKPAAGVAAEGVRPQ